MRPVTYDPLHNPFQNRFNYPVTCRRDEMQSDAYKVWLRERNKGNCKTQTSAKQMASGSNAFDPAHWGRLFASGIVLFLLLLASWAVLRAF